MSPETPNSTPETQSEKRNYAEEVRGLKAELSDREPLERVDALRSFVDSVLDDAEGGKIVSSKGEAYSEESIEGNFDRLAFELNTSKWETDPLLLVPRDGGLRAAFADLLTTETTAQNFLDAISSTVSERQAEREAGAKVAHDLGEEAVKASSFEKEDSKYDELFDPNREDNSSVEAAAVRTEEPEGDRLARERARDDQAAWNENTAKYNRGK